MLYTDPNCRRNIMHTKLVTKKQIIGQLINLQKQLTECHMQIPSERQISEIASQVYAKQEERLSNLRDEVTQRLNELVEAGVIKRSDFKPLKIVGK